jgi:hypothetical protein
MTTIVATVTTRECPRGVPMAAVAAWCTPSIADAKSKMPRTSRASARRRGCGGAGRDPGAAAGSLGEPVAGRSTSTAVEPLPSAACSLETSDPRATEPLARRCAVTQALSDRRQSSQSIAIPLPVCDVVGSMAMACVAYHRRDSSEGRTGNQSLPAVREEPGNRREPGFEAGGSGSFAPKRMFPVAAFGARC